MDPHVAAAREQLADALLNVVLVALKEQARVVLAEHGREAQAIRDVLMGVVLCP